MTPTLEQVKSVVGGVKDLSTWYDAMVSKADAYDINTPERWAGFISQTAHESANYRYMEENLYYSAKQLNVVFTKYFKNAGRKTTGYAKKPEKIANLVYANRMGNGDVKSGDGYRYRGRGIIQLTGKNNYEKFAEYKDMSLGDVVEYLSTKEGAIESAMWYWKVNGLNKHCDDQDIVDMTVAINGGKNGLSHRTELWEKALSAFGAEDRSAPLFDGIISVGDRGKEVAEIQKVLGIVTDGIFGPNTKRAVKAYQRKNRLIPDGVVGPLTYSRMVGK